MGAILTPGQRTVAAALRVMGRGGHHDYARYHEVLNRVVWSSRLAARILQALLLQYLDRGGGPLVFGIDETLERRRGPKIKSGASTGMRCVPAATLGQGQGLRFSLMWLGHVLGGTLGTHSLRAGALGTTTGSEPSRLGAAMIMAPLALLVGGRQRLRRAGPLHCCQSLRR